MSDRYIEGIHSDIIYEGSYGYVCNLRDHENFFVNIYKKIYLVCDQCRKAIAIGYGVLGDWWDETEEMWKTRWEHIRDYDFGVCESCGSDN